LPWRMLCAPRMLSLGGCFATIYLDECFITMLLLGGYFATTGPGRCFAVVFFYSSGCFAALVVFFELTLSRHLWQWCILLQV
jgi:hypothetical protein